MTPCFSPLRNPRSVLHCHTLHIYIPFIRYVKKSLVVCVSKCGMGIEQPVVGDGDDVGVEHGMFIGCG